LPIFFRCALSRHKINSKTKFLPGGKNWEAQKILQQIVHSKLFYSLPLLLEMIFFFYNFCQFSSGGALGRHEINSKTKFLPGGKNWRSKKFYKIVFVLRFAVMGQWYLEFCREIFQPLLSFFIFENLISHWGMLFLRALKRDSLKIMQNFSARVIYLWNI